MGFLSSCSAICQKTSPDEVDFAPVDQMDWFELTLGNTPPAKNFVSELYERLVNPASDETVEKIVKSMGKANHEKALRAVASPFMKVVDTVKQDVAKKDNLLKTSNIQLQELKQRNENVLSELVANPKLKTMREVVEKFNPNWKRILLKWRYYIKSENLIKEVERRFPLHNDPIPNIKTLDKILSYFNRMTDFVVYLHKSCSHSKVVKSSWFNDQLNEIDRAASYYRGRYLIYHFNRQRYDESNSFTSSTISRSLRCMRKFPKGVDFIFQSAPILHKLGLLYTCGTNMYWPPYFRVKLLLSLYYHLPRDFPNDKQMYAGVMGLSIWIYAMLYLHSLSQNHCVPSDISLVLHRLKFIMRLWSPVVHDCPTTLINGLFPLFTHLRLNEHDWSIGRQFAPAKAMLQHVEKICKEIMRNYNNETKKEDIEVPISDQSTNDGGSASDHLDNDDSVPRPASAFV